MASRALFQVRDTMGRAGAAQRGMATVTRRRLKSLFTAAEEGEGGSRGRSKWAKGDYMPVYVAIGMIAVAVGFGAHTLKQQLKYAPAVSVKKGKRETLPELAEPEAAARQSDNFVKKSFFRKVAHVQEVDTPVPDTIRGDALAKQPKMESLKDVGVDPKAAAPASASVAQ